MTDSKISLAQRLSALAGRVRELVDFCWTGVWRVPRNSLGIRTIKIINLSIRTFMDRQLQTQSMSLTYSTVLAIVPALALLFAIGRGFGFQNLISEELYKMFPAQEQVIATATSFVDSYLKEASQGVFVGVGLVLLLWTLISLLSSIEDSFNMLWDIRKGRTLFQKITDYIAICLIVPVLLVCSSGISIFMTSAVDDGLSFLTPLVNVVLELSPLILAWIAFSVSYALIPNTKVKFKYAAISGAICAIVFDALQWLFVTGQIYVSKYNAIYGSFAFLPLLLIWLQLSWLILLFGCVLTYSMQNVFGYNFVGEIENISEDYMRRISLIVMTSVIKNFDRHADPMSPNEISIRYQLPFRLVSHICEKLYRARMVYFTVKPGKEYGVAPAVDNDTFTVGDLFSTLDSVGETDFIPRFDTNYKDLTEIASASVAYDNGRYDNTLLRDLPIEEPEEQPDTGSV